MTISQVVRWVAVALIAVAGVTQAQAQLQGMPDPRYKCGGPPPNPTTGECDPEPWDDSTRALFRIDALLKMQKYDPLERSLELNADPKRLRPNGFPKASHLLRAFDQLYPNPEAAKDSLANVEAWKKATPNSRFIPLFEAAYWRSAAWSARGSGYASSVSKEGWALFHERLSNAEKILATAPDDLKATAVWHEQRLINSLDKDGMSPATVAVFRAGIKAYPEYIPLYRQMVVRMLPKWGGTFSDLEVFIESSTQGTAKTLGRSLYAWLYVFTIHEHSPGETEISWPKAKASFRDLVKRYDSPEWPQKYASYACWSKDREAFDEAMDLVRRNPVESASWLPGHGPDACRLWAGQKAS